MSGLNLFAKLTKVDEAQRLIYGRAVDETPDRSGEVFDYATSKPHFQKWSDETRTASDGQSLGNLRAMHGKVAAGKLTGIDFDDVGKAIDVVAKVVDDNEWKKVLEGVYTGFSIGGSYVKKWDDASIKKDDGKAMKRYTAGPSELSLVDRPCVPSSKFFDIQKADGVVEKGEFQHVLTDEAVEAKARELAKRDNLDPDGMEITGDIGQLIWKTFADKAVDALTDEAIEKRDFSEKQRENLAAKGKAMPDGSFPINNATDLANAIKDSGRAKDPAAAKAHILERAKALKLTDALPADWEGSTKKDDAGKADEPTEYQVEGSDDEVAKLATIMHDSKLAMADVLKFVGVGIDLASENADRTAILKFETDGKLKKGMYTVGVLANIVAQLESLRESIVNEETREGDEASVLPQKSLDLLGTATDLLQAMVVEESAEVLGEMDDDGNIPDMPVMQMAHFGDLKKVGARNSAMDSAAIQKMHDLANSLGATCGNKEAADHGGALAKVDIESLTETILAKVREDTSGALAKLEASNGELLAKVAKLEAMPAVPRGVLRAIGKGESLGDPDAPQIQPVIEKGAVNEAASLIKMAHHNGGVALGLRPDGSSIL